MFLGRKQRTESAHQSRASQLCCLSANVTVAKLLVAGATIVLWLGAPITAAIAQNQPVPAPSQGSPNLPETVVEGQTPPAPTSPQPAPPPAPAPATGFFQSLLRSAPAASQGIYGQETLSIRPLFSPTSILDPIPGLTTTMENTGSDASVYYVRGVNTEHGSDFALWLDDMPLNLPSHAHAQGIANLNILIPELIETVDYRKGSYYADLGDFSTLGAAKISQFRRLDQNLSSVGAGQYGWVRLLQANTVEQWSGDVTYAADVSYFDDGWDIAQRNQRYKGFFRHTVGDDYEGLSSTLMAYHSDWRSTDAQPIDSIIDNGRFSNLDPTTGGRHSRYSWNTQYWREDADGGWKANFYTVYDRFDVWINPEQEIDEQVFQPDQRVIMGLNVARRFDFIFRGRPSSWTVGLQMRNDDIDRVRRDVTEQRVFVDAETSHKINIFTVSPYLQHDMRWNNWFRSVVGLRSDLYRFDVRDLLDDSLSGRETAGPVCPKLSLIFGPWTDTEYYLNLGTGFHSNDARNFFDPTNPVSPIARTRSAEVGMRSEAFENWITNVAVWYQEFDSELVFNAEEGEIEALGPSRRYGVEWNNRLVLTDWLFWDVDWAWSHARFTNGDFIPQSLSDILKTGPVAQLPNGWYALAQFTHFSRRPLNEEGSIFSNSVQIANLQVGRRWGQWQASLDWFNFLGSRDFAQVFDEGGELFVRVVDPQQVRFSLRRYY